MYIKKTYDLGDVREVYRYYRGNQGAPGCPRGPKKKKTPEGVAKQNQKNKEKRVQRLILMNFHEGDWHLTLTYRPDERPESMKEAKEQIQSFLGKMRAAYKKAGIPFRYIYVTERGKKGACHHHLIIEDINQGTIQTTKLVQKFWKHGNRSFIPLYQDGEFENLAAYIVKKETKEEGAGCSYSRSRNLIIPEPKIEKVHAHRWRKEPKASKGWYIEKETLINGENPYTGNPYQSYRERRIRNEKGRRKVCCIMRN